MAVLVALVLASCGGDQQAVSTTSSHASHIQLPADGPTSRGRAVNIYSADAAGDLSAAVKGDPALVYVPNSESNTVTVISQRTMKVLRQFQPGSYRSTSLRPTT